MNDEKLRGIVRALSDARGDDLLNNIVLALSKSIDADFTFVAEINRDKTIASTLALSSSDTLLDNFSYALKETPCEKVVGNRVCIHACNIQSLYPKDELLVEMGIEGYVGTPLYSQNRDVIGLVVALFKEPVTNSKTVETLFLLFSGMIAGEMEKRKQAEQLELSQRVLDSCEDSIMICDTGNQITYVNTAFELATGYSRDEVLGLPPGILKSGRHDKRFYQSMWRAIEESDSWSGEVWNRKKDGTIYPAWLTISTVKTKDGTNTHFTAMLKDITEVKEAEEKIHYQATHDLMTGLSNRPALQKEIVKLITKCSRKPRPFSLIMIDLDHFKAINDQYGHEAGDKVLTVLGSLLQEEVRGSDIAGRWGGEEFMVVCDDTDLSGAYALAEKLRLSIAIQDYALPSQITASLGVVQYLPQEEFSSLFSRADQMLYKAKNAGRNQVITHSCCAATM